MHGLQLPDFIEALEKVKTDRRVPEAKFPQVSPPAAEIVTTSGTSTSELRYEAYDAQQAIPSLRIHHTSRKLQDRVSESRSDAGSTGTHSSISKAGLRYLETGSPFSVQPLDESIQVREFINTVAQCQCLTCRKPTSSTEPGVEGLVGLTIFLHKRRQLSAIYRMRGWISLRLTHRLWWSKLRVVIAEFQMLD